MYISYQLIMKLTAANGLIRFWFPNESVCTVFPWVGFEKMAFQNPELLIEQFKPTWISPYAISEAKQTVR